jgi:alanyl-tRNA synthetase
MPVQSSEVRQKFLAFYEARGHTAVPSAPLITAGDPTLLFVNAGMVPFKDVFLGVEKRSYSRAASSQKCLRVSGKHNDLEEVGPSPRHHTFFEMLGKFSFGDYFKDEALSWTWEFLTKEMGIEASRLHPTVYVEDDESAEIWSKLTGRPVSGIVRLGAEDNFWSMGDTGPCGPNSELMYDRTGKCLRDGRDCDLTCECGRWWEVCNDVFMQYDRSADGTLTPLPNLGVDFGGGLERLTALLNDVDSDYETDSFVPLIEMLRSLTGDAEVTLERRPYYRAVADHARAMTFLISDGIVPSNEGRGYVLRRILRRASYQARSLGVTEPFLSTICEVVIEKMREPYPELDTNKPRILDTVRTEEERFLATLEAGVNRLERLVSEMKGTTTLAGEEAFRLHDTYGFPLDLTRKVLEPRGLTVDERGFERAMDEQRKRAREAGEGARGLDAGLADVVNELPPTEFLGYGALTTDSTVLALLRGGERVGNATEGQELGVVLSVSPFYAEGGGQVGDAGRLVAADGEVAVEDVRKVGHGVFVHSGRVTLGTITEGETARAEVDRDARRATMRNHTATHLLHKALRVVLGPQAGQAGSLVAPDRLRFDFFHGKPLSDDELRETERLVREQVLENKLVRTDVMSMTEAKELGADAMFDEKYGEDVRVVSVANGDDLPEGQAFSRELCGGTHCHSTGEIGAFVITGQQSVGSGIRRVEALTGFAAFEWIDQRRAVLDVLSRELNASVEELTDRLQQLQERAKGVATPTAPLPDPIEVLARAAQSNGTAIIVERLDGVDADTLRRFGDDLRQRTKSAAIALGTIINEKPSIAVMLTTDRVEAGLDASSLAKEIGRAMGAGGGGKRDVATAGGTDASKLEEGLAVARRLLEQRES